MNEKDKRVAGEKNDAKRPKGTTRRRFLIGSGAVAVAGLGASGWELSKPGGKIIMPGRSRARKVASSTVMPTETDVVVIGGGFVGTAAALTLAERNVSVTLCEKGVVAGEASGRSHGQIDSQYLDPVKMELIARSKELWRGLNERTGLDTGFRTGGLTCLLADEEAIAGAESWLESVRGLPGVDARLLSAREIAAMQPGAARHYPGAMFQPSDASAEPTLAVPAIAEAAVRHGATLLQNCAVRAIETSGGRVSAVVTERGRIKTSSVVLAGGVWSPFMAKSLGLDLPQFQAHSSMRRIRPAKGPAISAWAPEFTWRPMIDGSYSICATNGVVPITPATIKNVRRLIPALRAMWSEVDPVFNYDTFMSQWNIPDQWDLEKPSPFEQNRVLMPEIRKGVLDNVQHKIETAFPAFKGARHVEDWAGVLVTTLDNMPVLSPVDTLPGLYLGTGFYYGLTMGPAAGEALADLVMGNRPKFGLDNYRYERFSDGSELIFRS